MGRTLTLALLLSFSLLSPAFELGQGSSNPYDLSNIVYNPTNVTALATFHLGEDSLGEVPITHLTVNITYDNPQRLRIRITDNSTARWEVPYDLASYSIQGSMGAYNVSLNVNPMGIQVVRSFDSKVVFNLDPNVFFRYDDEDIYFVNNLGYNINVLGLGERITSFIIPTGTYTLWALDQASPIDNGQSQTANMYSSQPFYMIVDEDDGSAFGGLLYNSNAMSAIVGQTSLGFRVTGGIIDLYLFMGPQPEDVIFQYHQLVGAPIQVPYWSLGWHQCRYGYPNATYLTQVYNNYTLYNIPLDALWSDIDLYSGFQDFILNATAYPVSNMTNLITTLLSFGKNYVPIVDAGIAQNLNNAYYNLGTQMNVWIQNPYVAGTPAVGVVWPGNATFVDWLHPNASLFWQQCLDDFLNVIPYSGVWLDMNEVSNFINGLVGHNPTIINSTTMPWVPGNDPNYKSLDVGSLHYGNVQEFNVHNLYGYLETKATSQFYTTSGERPFIISRSSFPGSGKYGSKWLGDNYSQWSFMQISIDGIFNFGMFGIPLIGADICGFMGNTNLELCARWTQLGTMYPFSRNHNDNKSVPQEPWAFGPELVETNQISIRNKYMLYLYFYTHMMRLSQEGGMFFKPAFWQYPQDMNLFYNATVSFMLGSALIVHPCLWQGVNGTTSYFPDDIWYDLYTGEYMFLDYDNQVYLNMPWPGLINIHITQGHIVPLLDSYTTAMSSRDLRGSNLTLLITQSPYDAIGTIILDNGIDLSTPGTYTEIEYQLYSYNSTFDLFSVQELDFGYTPPSGEFPYISTLVFYGCTAAPESVYKFAKGTLTMIPTIVNWNAEEMICKIWLRGNLGTNELAVLFIDYYI